jgi:hypothetical protein
VDLAPPFLAVRDGCAPRCWMRRLLLLPVQSVGYSADDRGGSCFSRDGSRDRPAATLSDRLLWRSGLRAIQICRWKRRRLSRRAEELPHWHGWGGSVHVGFRRLRRLHSADGFDVDRQSSDSGPGVGRHGQDRIAMVLAQSLRHGYGSRQPQLRSSSRLHLSTQSQSCVVVSADRISSINGH